MPGTRLLCTSIALLAMVTLAHAAESAHPNVIVILADDIGSGDLSCYGATRVNTRHLDRLAAEGCRFTDGHAPSSTCTPSRYAMLTGQYAFRKKGTGILPGGTRRVSPFRKGNWKWIPKVCGKMGIGGAEGQELYDLNAELAES